MVEREGAVIPKMKCDEGAGQNGGIVALIVMVVGDYFMTLSNVRAACYLDKNSRTTFLALKHV